MGSLGNEQPHFFLAKSPNPPTSHDTRTALKGLMQCESKSKETSEG